MLTETILRWVTEYGYIGIFSLLALGILGAPIPDEGVLAFAGYLVYEGKLQLFPMAAAFFGSVWYHFKLWVGAYRWHISNFKIWSCRSHNRGKGHPC